MKSQESESAIMSKPDDWSQDCLEYLFDNKVWLPGIVRPESTLTYDDNNTP